MAAPTLTSITPSSGHPGGKEIVRIEGTNFELPPAPPVTGYVGGSSPETVEVEIDGEMADEVKVWTSELITCLVPPYRGDPSALSASPGLAVDVVIRNLTGPEEDTFAGAYTYARPSMARADGPLRHVLRTLVRQLRREVLDYIAFGTHVDYDANTGDALDIVELAQNPALALFGPDISENKFRRTSESENSQDIPALTYTKSRVYRICDLRFDVTITARGMMELTHLMQEFLSFFRRNPLLEVNADTTDPSAGRYGFDMFLDSGPSRAGGANNDDVYTASASFVVVGVPIDSDEPTQVEWGKVMDDPPDVEVTYEQQEL